MRCVRRLFERFRHKFESSLKQSFDVEDLIGIRQLSFENQQSTKTLQQQLIFIDQYSKHRNIRKRLFTKKIDVFDRFCKLMVKIISCTFQLWKLLIVIANLRNFFSVFPFCQILIVGTISDSWTSFTTECQLTVLVFVDAQKQLLRKFITPCNFNVQNIVQFQAF